jgi:hypothetical protein
LGRNRLPEQRWFMTEGEGRRSPSKRTGGGGADRGCLLLWAFLLRPSCGWRVHGRRWRPWRGPRLSSCGVLLLRALLLWRRRCLARGPRRNESTSVGEGVVGAPIQGRGDFAKKRDEEG